MPKPIRVSSRHYGLFRKYAMHWLEQYGYEHWEARFEQKPLESPAVLCQVEVVDPSFIAYFSVNTVWDPDWGSSMGLSVNEEIERLAFHEVRHLAYARLIRLAKERFVTQSELEQTEHELIQHDELAFFGPRK